MRTVLKTLFVVSVAIGAGFGSVARAEETGSIRDEVVQAHRSYLKKDWKGMLARVKTVLANSESSDAMKNNVIRLVESANYQSGGNLPVDWQLPEEVKRLRVAVSRHDRTDKLSYKFRIVVSTQHRDEVQSLAVYRQGETLLDLENNKGRAETEQDDDGYKLTLSMMQNAPVPEGLYLFKLGLKNGKSVDGWFVLSNHIAKESLKIHQPVVGETYRTAQPSFRWEDFRSSSYQPYERRSIYVSIAKQEPPRYDWEQVFETWEYEASLTDLTVGKGPASTLKELKDGRYTLLVNYGEISKFGPMQITRESQLARSFFVKTAR